MLHMHVHRHCHSHLTHRPLQAFIKTVNYQHMMPTRYTLDVDLKSVVSTWGDVENSSAREEARKVRDLRDGKC